MAIRGIFFDIDGTLVDSNDQHVSAWQEALAAIGAVFSREAIHDQIGKGADMLIPALLPALHETAREELAEARSKLFKNRYLSEVKPFPQAHDLLRHAAQAGQAIVLASSASRQEVDHHLTLLDAHKIVHCTTSADDVAHSKPAPDIFAHALQKVSPLAADEVLVVGDTPYDVTAARRCGIAAVALRSGKFPDQALREAGAIALYDDAAALLKGYDTSPLAG